MIDLQTATAFEIETDFDAYRRMVEIMTRIDGVQPAGACCGRNKAQHCQQFVRNREKYLFIMEKIQNRTIQPKASGRLVHVTTEQKMYLLDNCSDEEILHLVEIGAVEKDFFDWRKYEGKKEETSETAEKIVKTEEKPKSKKKR